MPHFYQEHLTIQTNSGYYHIALNETEATTIVWSVHLSANLNYHLY